jgi:hypothetical protein
MESFQSIPAALGGRPSGKEQAGVTKGKIRALEGNVTHGFFQPGLFVDNKGRSFILPPCPHIKEKLGLEKLFF